MNKGLKRQQNASRAEMIDSYRNAPPHQVCKSMHVIFALEICMDIESINFYNPGNSDTVLQFGNALMYCTYRPISVCHLSPTTTYPSGLHWFVVDGS